MKQLVSCDKTNVIIGSSWGPVDVPLTDWIEYGPGSKWYVQPFQIKCLDDETDIPLFMLPIQYRNNSLSHFLFATNILPYPWDLSNIKKAKVDIFRWGIENNSRSNYGVEINIQDMGDYGWKVNLGDLSFSFDIQISPRLGKLFGSDQLFLFPKTSAKREQLKLNKELSSDFVMMIELLSSGPKSIEDTESFFIPDSSFSDSVQRGNASIRDKPTRYTLSESHKYQCSLVTVVHLVDHLPHGMGMRWLKVFALGHNNNSGVLLDKSLETISLYEEV